MVLEINSTTLTALPLSTTLTALPLAIDTENGAPFIEEEGLQENSEPLEINAAALLASTLEKNTLTLDRSKLFSRIHLRQPSSDISTATETALHNLAKGATDLFNSTVAKLDDFFAGIVSGFKNLEPAFAGAVKVSPAPSLQLFSVNKTDGALNSISATEQDRTDYLSFKTTIEIKKIESDLVAVIKSSEGKKTYTLLDESTLQDWLDQLTNTSSDLYKDKTLRRQVISILSKIHVIIMMKFPGISLRSPLLEIAANNQLPVVERLLALGSEQVREAFLQPELKHIWAEFNSGHESITQNEQALAPQALASKSMLLSMVQKAANSNDKISNIGLSIATGGAFLTTITPIHTSDNPSS